MIHAKSARSCPRRGDRTTASNRTGTFACRGRRPSIRGSRRLIAAFVFALLLPIVRANADDKIWRIGHLSARPGPYESSQIFIQRLKELGYVEGRSLIVEYRWAAGRNDRLAELASDLVRAKVDLIVTVGTPPTFAAKQATQTIPIVFSLSHPVEKGIVASLAHPGGNITGVEEPIYETKALELLKQVAPGVSGVEYLHDPATGASAHFASDQDQARTLGITLQPIPLREPGETEAVFAALPADATGLLLASSAINVLARDRICSLATQRRLPTAGNDLAFARAGCLLSYGVDDADIARRRADYVDRILKDARPADLPVELPTKFALVINLKTAKELGLAVPLSLLARADEVIE
jgi:putative ABC transport system substrate-binding protein